MNDTSKIKQVAEERDKYQQRFEHFRGLVEAAHKKFHELVGPSEPVRFQHSEEEDNDPAALLCRIAAARDEARDEVRVLCPLTEEEAQAAYDAIEEIVKFATEEGR